MNKIESDNLQLIEIGKESYSTRPPRRRPTFQETLGLTAEPVQGPALPLESVDDVHRGDRLAASVLSVGDCITDDVLQKDLENSSGFLVDEAADTLHTATTGQTADGGLGDSLDVITEDLSVPLGSSLS
ncbi:hypothetical protein LINPERPRIM_LOCUS26587 [Linum perenne]